MQNPFGGGTWNRDQLVEKKKTRTPRRECFHLSRSPAEWLRAEFGGHGTPPPLPMLPNGRVTHLVELDPLLASLGVGVGDPQGSELGSEQVGGVLLHGGNVEAEYPGGDSLRAKLEVVCG